MTRYVPDESDVREVWVDFKVDHSNTPLTQTEAISQYEGFLRRVKADALFDYADYLEATTSAFADMMTDEDDDETRRTIDALRARGHQVKEGT